MLSRAFCDEKVELLTLFSGSFLRDSWSSHISPSPRLSLYLSSAEKHPSLSLTFSLPPLLRFFPLSISLCLSQPPSSSSSLLSPLSRSRQLQQRSVCLHWRSSVRLWADWILSHFNPTEQVLNEGGDEERRERITGTQANHKPPLSLSRFFSKLHPTLPHYNFIRLPVLLVFPSYCWLTSSSCGEEERYSQVGAKKRHLWSVSAAPSWKNAQEREAWRCGAWGTLGRGDEGWGGCKKRERIMKKRRD